jgi:hypothetical protein
MVAKNLPAKPRGLGDVVKSGRRKMIIYLFLDPDIDGDERGEWLSSSQFVVLRSEKQTSVSYGHR